MEVYILKSAACLGILFLFYKLALENTSLHTTKRFFLLGSLVLSLVIPFITFTEYIEVAPLVIETFTEIPTTSIEPTVIIAAEPTHYFPYMLGGIYALGVLIFSFRFGRNMLRILNKVRNNPKFKNQSIFHVLLKLPVTPHSFFNYIFFSKTEYEAGNIPQEVIVHETAHVAQKHSWDIVFFEVLRIVFWFNPLLYFIKHSIKLNHEFLADRTVLNQGADASIYQTILLDFSSTSSVPAMAHSINYSSIKKRFTVMKTHTSKRAACLKGLLILPLLAMLIYGFSSTKTVEKPSSTYSSISNIPIPTARSIEIQIEPDGTYIVEGMKATKNTLAGTVAKLHQDLTPAIRNHMMNIHITRPIEPSREELQFVYDALLDYGFYRLVASNQEVVLGKGNTPMASETTTSKLSKDKATQVQINIYNKLAKKYNAVPIAERKIGWEDLKTLENIYRLMDDTQKQNALPFPECNLENKISWEKEYAKVYNDGAAKNNKKSIVITINVSKIMVNGKTTTLKNFAKEVDRATKDWTTADYQAAYPSVLAAATPTSFMEKLDAEFRKTNYFKANKGVSIIPTSPPPPPPPATDTAPRVLKGVNDQEPNMPPPPSNAPKVIKGVNDTYLNNPPPPPPPSPLDHIIEMAKKGAAFYFENEEISSDKAIALIKKNKNLNIETKMSSGQNKPQVRLSAKSGIISTANASDTYKLTARSMDIKILDDGSYMVNSLSANKNTLLKTVRKFNQDITKDTRNKILNIHVSHSKKLPDEEIYYIFDALKEYGYYRMVTPSQEIIMTKKNTPVGYSANAQSRPTLKMTLFDPPNLGTKTDSNDASAILDVLTKNGAKLWHNSDVISEKEALALLKKHPRILIDTVETPHDVPSIVFSETKRN